jgi:hypothetical protein
VRRGADAVRYGLQGLIIIIIIIMLAGAHHHHHHHQITKSGRCASRRLSLQNMTGLEMGQQTLSDRSQCEEQQQL